jgi:glutamine phosphoribosylpyrophosphate amidotransferase
MDCKGSEEKILEVMGQIRGDYAIILIEGDQIFILKDYFGKRSLLLGMSEDHLMLSSCPFENFQAREEPNGENPNVEEEND